MKQIFKFICCGNVDDGKSTLLGRILLDTGNVKKDQMEDAIKASVNNSSNTVELAMLLDGLLSEREQQITIDIAHRYFDYKDIRFHIYDCPGHKQYTKNMAIAAAEADAAIAVIDVTKGIQEQTKKHLQICSLFNIKNITICLTKCDLIIKNKKPDYKVINKLSAEIGQLMNDFNFQYKIIPISALSGYNVPKVLKQLCADAKIIYQEKQKNKSSILHVLTSKSYKNERYYYGREINNSNFKIGHKYTVLPQNIKITIDKYPQHGCIQIIEKVDITQGDCITDKKMIISDVIKHKTVWFDKPSKKMLLKHGSRIARIVKYSDETLKIDTPLIFNNIEDVKPNGIGMIFDHDTKKTIGCCVFTGNNNSKTNEIKNEIYVLSGKNITKGIKNKISKSLNINPLFVETEKLVKNSPDITKNKIFEFSVLYAKELAKQGYDVFVTTQDKIFQSVLKKETLNIIEEAENYTLFKIKN